MPASAKMRMARSLGLLNCSPRYRDRIYAAASADPPRPPGWRSLDHLPLTSDAPCRRPGTERGGSSPARWLTAYGVLARANAPYRGFDPFGQGRACNDSVRALPLSARSAFCRIRKAAVLTAARNGLLGCSRKSVAPRTHSLDLLRGTPSKIPRPWSSSDLSELGLAARAWHKPKMRPFDVCKPTFQRRAPAMRVAERQRF